MAHALSPIGKDRKVARCSALSLSKSVGDSGAQGNLLYINSQSLPKNMRFIQS
jgi:hypothetical protein